MSTVDRNAGSSRKMTDRSPVVSSNNSVERKKPIKIVRRRDYGASRRH